MLIVRNVGTVDSIIRIVAGSAIVITGIVFQSWLGALGLIPILTGVFQFCPAYLPFGIKTTGKGK